MVIQRQTARIDIVDKVGGKPRHLPLGPLAGRQLDLSGPCGFEQMENVSDRFASHGVAPFGCLLSF
jgi:hypothetical protein